MQVLLGTVPMQVSWERSNMGAVTLVVLAALVIKVIDWLKQIQNRQWNAVITQLIVWLAGWGVLLIAAQTQWAPQVSIFGLALSRAGVWDLLFIGLCLGSTGSIGWQTIANVGGGNQEVITPLTGLSRPGFRHDPPHAAASGSTVTRP